jgi:starvation-inducible DNA-binding protein
MATATTEVHFNSSVKIDEDVKSKVIEILNARLADTLDMKTQAKHAHWNVKGIHFFQLHELFDSIATHLEDHSDLIAERLVQLGGVANGTARQSAANSSIKEYDLHAVKGEEHVKALVQRLSTLANAARKAIDDTGKLGDQATADLFTEVTRAADKDLWFLEAHLQG